MCGIIGYLDRRGPGERPVGRVLLNMLQALSCRGPDSAGVALFGAPRPFWLLQVKLSEHGDPAAAAADVLAALRDVGPVHRHQVNGVTLRAELDRSADPCRAAEQLADRVPGAEVVSLGRQLE
ncbi:MAG TPA: hypothetical protein VJ739_03330, partial [Gemmataceae bacterium]|nr:hypothetical protein [Gemmataceae bacterium]